MQMESTRSGIEIGEVPEIVAIREVDEEVSINVYQKSYQKQNKQ